MLTVQGLRASYGRIPILHGIDLPGGEGAFVGILGHHGMGKSTLLKTLIGLLKATAGRIEFAGQDITQAPPHRRGLAGLGYVPQGRAIFGKLTVRENLELGAVEHQSSKVLRERLIAEVLEELPRLKPILSRPGGVLMLDEPTEGIQPSIVEEIIEILKQIRQRRGLTVIVVEQDLDFIAALSERVYVIQRGRITGELSPEHLADPEVVQEFVGMGTR